MSQHFKFDADVPLLGDVQFNGMTGPGYVMAVAWGLYAIVLVLAFKEPVRIDYRAAAGGDGGKQSENIVVDFFRR